MSIWVPILTGWLSWWMISLLAGVLVFPAMNRLLPTPFSWAFSRFGAPYFFSWLILCPSIFFAVTVSTPVFVLVAALLGISSWGLFARGKWQLSKKQLQEIVYSEITFGCFFLFVCLLLALNGSLLGNDDMRDTAIWTSLWMDPKFPAEDPWLAGNELRYYILGIYPLLFLGKLSIGGPLESYNLALSYTMANYFLLVALCLKAFGISRQFVTGGAVLATIGCNLQSALQVVKQIVLKRPFNSTTVFLIDSGTNYAVCTPLLGFFWHAVHPDYVAYPLFVAVIALCVATLQSKDSNRWLIQAVLGGFFTSWIWGTNTWNVPSAILTLLATRVFFDTSKHRLKTCLSDWKWWGSLLATTLLFSWPSFQLSAGTPAKLFLTNTPTPAMVIWRHWGLWWTPIAILALMALPHRVRWAAAACATALIVFNLPGNWLFVAIAGVALYLLQKERVAQSERLICFFVLLGVVFASVPEWIYLAEKWARFNTVLKLNGPSWALFALASIGAITNLREKLHKQLWLGLLMIFVATQSMFLFYSSSKQLREVGFQPIDNKHKVQRLYPEDKELIAKWTSMDAKTLASAQIVEASGTEYSPKMFGRISALSGAKSFLLFNDHQHQWLLYGGKPEIELRKQVVAKIYGGEYSTCAELRQLLQTNGITAVVTGQLERETYAPKDIEKLQSCL
jgi:uncharacterized membrane protein